MTISPSCRAFAPICASTRKILVLPKNKFIGNTRNSQKELDIGHWRSLEVIGGHWRSLEVDSDQSKACSDDKRRFVDGRMEWDGMDIISRR